ncbi:hypothetical protein ACFY2H_31695 [Streptomyces griseofuscus]|uniref:hypothetical protein n=1 Tax=Streptomyces griseofuscus TaxID=146922 RepID=UPI0036B536A1
MLHPLPNERRCRCRCRCERLLHRPKARAATAAHPPLHVLPLHRLLSQLRLSGERCTAVPLHAAPDTVGPLSLQLLLGVRVSRSLVPSIS